MIKAYLELLSRGYLSIKGVPQGNVVHIPQPFATFGRDPKRADLCLMNASVKVNDQAMLLNYVSGVHFTVFYDLSQHQYLLLDNHSKNGTRLNDEKLKAGEYYPLKSGSQIEVGVPTNGGALLRFYTHVFEDADQHRTSIYNLQKDTSPLPPSRTHTNTSSLKHRIFLSHSSEDNAITQSLRHQLLASPLADLLDIWMDESNLQVGENWMHSIEVAIRRSIGVVVIVSPAALQSEWVKREISYAIHHKKKLFAVQVQKVNQTDIPIGLQDVQWLNLAAEYDQKMAELIDELQKLHEQGK